MAQYPPPSENVPTFDASLFIGDTTGLTRAKADSLYVHYPVSQGVVTFPGLVSSSTIDAGNQQINCGNLYAGSVVSCDTLHYTTLDPPIAPGAVPTLSEVLTAGNSAPTQEMSVQFLSAQDLSATQNTITPMLQLGASGISFALFTNPTGLAVEINQTTNVTGSISATSNVIADNSLQGTNVILGATPYSTSINYGLVNPGDAQPSVNMVANMDIGSGNFTTTGDIITTTNVRCHDLYYTTLHPTAGVLASALMPFLNTDTYTVSTTSLEPTAQTALASAVTALEDVTILQVTALQESGGTYTGLLDTEMLINGGIVANSFSTTGNVTCNTLNYTTLNPPVTGSQNLSQVLTTGNDAGSQAITGLTNIVANQLEVQSVLIDVDGIHCSKVIQCTNALGTTNLKTNRNEIYSDNGGTLKAVIDITGDGYFKDLYLFGVNPIDFAITNDKNIKTTGNVTCNTLSYTTLDPPINPFIPQSLNDVLTIGNNAGTQAITNLSTINGIVPQFRPSYDYYVSKNGSDSNIGSVLNPFLTIQKAIIICEAFTDGLPRIVNVSAGTFTENLTISKSRISIKGEGVNSHPDIGTAIYGNITINLTSGDSDINNNNIYISGFLITGLMEDPTITYVHRLHLSNVQLYATDRVLYIHPNVDYRVFCTNCTISNYTTTATNPLIECGGSGMVTFISNQITSKGNAQNTFKITGSCRVDTFAQNILTCDGTGNNIALAIFNHNSSATVTIGQSAFIYSSSGTKRNTDTASGIYISSTGSLVIVNNIFSLSGLPATDKAVYSTVLAFPTTLVIYGLNTSTSSALGATASTISGVLNTTKFSMTAVS